VNDIDLDIVEQYGKLSVLYKIIVNLQNEATREQAILKKLKKKKGKNKDEKPLILTKEMEVKDDK